jgi:hypothetical protein
MRFNRNTLIFLAGSLIVIVLAVLLLNKPATDSTATATLTVALRPLFGGANATDVVSFTVRDEVAVAESVYIQQPDGSWGLESSTTGKNGPLTQSTLDNSVATVLNLQATNFASEKRVDFGLDKPGATIRFKTKAGDEHVVLLGSDVPGGSRRYALVDQDATNVYIISGSSDLNPVITLAGTPPIILPPTPTAVPSLQLPGPLFGGFDPYGVGRIELVDNKTNAKLVLVRDATTNWVAEEATNAVPGAAIDNSLVSVILSTFGFMQGTTAISVSDLSTVGLDKPAYTITLTADSSTSATGTITTYRIDVGNPDVSGALTYVRVAGYSEVATVLTKDLELLIDVIKTPPYLPVATAEAVTTAESTAEATAAATTAP